MTAVDFLARRIRIAFLDYRTAYDMLPTVIKVMGEELKWDKGDYNYKVVLKLHCNVAKV